jgi:hypothetical protein
MACLRRRTALISTSSRSPRYANGATDCAAPKTFGADLRGESQKIQPSRWSESQETPSFQGVPRSVLADLAEKQGLAATKAVQIAACAVFRKEFPNTVA